MINLNNNPDSAAAVTPDDSGKLAPTDGLFVGTGGHVYVDMASGGVNVPFKNIPNGTFLPICVKRVYSTGTTASDIKALYKTAQ